MKYLKLNDIYKVKDSTILIDFCIDYKNIELFINSSNIKNLKKYMKEKTITNAISELKKNEKNHKFSKKKPISVLKLNEYLKNFGIKYNFIGGYLLNIEYENVNYLLDFTNDRIEICDLLESFDNSDKEESIVISEENKIEDDLITKIKNINDSLPTNLESLIKFSIDNSEVLKSLLKIVNSKTDNLVGSVVNSFGLDLNLSDKINTDSEINNISNHLKIIEELNNNDVTVISFNEIGKFNFLINQIWNEIKLIISTLEKMLPNNNYKDILERYKNLFNDIGFKEELDNDILIDFTQKYINIILEKIIDSYFSSMESKYLELNILLQGNNDKFNDIINDKIKSQVESNYVLYSKYFKNIYEMEDVFNIFSDFNKKIKFDSILNRNNISINSNLLLLINDCKNNLEQFKDKDLKLKINDIEFCNNTDNTFDVSIGNNTNIINNFFNKYEEVINLIHPNYNNFSEKINEIYNKNILIKKKLELSNALKSFHEEVKFIISIVKKISSKIN